MKREWPQGAFWIGRAMPAIEGTAYSEDSFAILRKRNSGVRPFRTSREGASSRRPNLLH